MHLNKLKLNNTCLMDKKEHGSGEQVTLQKHLEQKHMQNLLEIKIPLFL
jgi:hypothetical protein